MARFCCVPGCNKEQYPGCGLSFHRMPVEEWMQKNWLKVIPGRVTKSSHVCSLHFKTDDFDPTRQNVLKWNAIPSLFLKNLALSDLSVSGGKEKKRQMPRFTTLSAVFDEECLNSDEGEDEPDQLQEGYYCNVCCQVIDGFRYICVECDDFDLCTGCETKGEHPEHYILRIPQSRSNDEIATVLERIRKELSEDKGKIDDSLKDEVKEEDPLADVKSDLEVPGDSDIQLLCMETIPLEDSESDSKFNELQKRKCSDKDEYVPLKRQTVDIAQHSSSIINTEDKKREDTEYKAFVYRKITVLPPSTDNSERKIVTVTSPFITKITNANPEKETNVGHHTETITNQSTSHLNEEPQISDYLKLETDKVLTVIPKLLSEANMTVTDVSQLTPQSKTVNNYKQHYTQPTDVSQLTSQSKTVNNYKQHYTQPTKAMPLTNNQIVVTNLSQTTAKSNTGRTKSQQLCTQPNTRPITIPRTAILKNVVKCETKNASKPESHSKIAVTNMSHLPPQHNIVTAKLQQQPMKVQPSTFNKSIMTNVSQITPRSNSVMTVSQELFAQQTRLIQQRTAIKRNDLRPDVKDVRRTLPLTSDAKIAEANMSNRTPQFNTVTGLHQNKTPQSNSATARLQLNKKRQSNTVATGLQHNRTPRCNTVPTELQQNRTLQSNTVTTRLQQNRTPQYNTVTTGLQGNRTLQSNIVTTGLQQNGTPQFNTVEAGLLRKESPQSNIVTANNVQQIPGRGNHQTMAEVRQNIYNVASNIHSVVPSFSNPVIPNFMPPPAPDLILELSQNDRENGININVKRMTSEEKNLLIKR